MIIHENQGCADRTYNFIEMSKCVTVVANKYIVNSLIYISTTNI